VYCPIQNIFVVVDQLDYVSRAKSDAGFSCVGKQGGHRAQVRSKFLDSSTIMALVSAFGPVDGRVTDWFLL
jgi:hypothetical protein